MKNTSLKKIQKILIGLMVLLVAIIAAGCILLLHQKKSNIAEQAERGGEEGLSDSTVWQPENCMLYSEIPEFFMTDRDGKQVSIRDFQGNPVVLVYWASWCEDCQKQMPYMNAYMQLARDYGDITFLFLNRTDGEKETKETAMDYFSKQQIAADLFYDDDLSAYDTLGLHNIPTTIFLDKDGRVAAWAPSQITESSKFQALLEKTLYGGSFATKEFIRKYLMDEQGGVHSAYGDAESEVLSESQGCMLEYAVESHEQELFDKLYSYVEQNMLGDGLAAWKVEEKQASKVNALLDDLRIYHALREAEKRWGGYEEKAGDYLERIKTYATEKQKYVDFYDSGIAEKADRLTLCYIDLSTMEQLAGEDADLKAAYENALSLLKEGRISEQFPLYYSYYDYNKKEYVQDDLNTAEALLTLLHLSEADMLPDDAVEWLKKQIEKDGLKARYTVDGDVVEDYSYESTAVYAIAAMIGVEEKDKELVDKAVRKMERMRIDDTSLVYNGAFGVEDGSGITSFDEIMPLLAYQRIELNER